MSDQTDKLLNALRNAAKEVERLRSEKQSLVDSRTESIAIVGMGCRYPGGVTGPENFWRLLDDGADAITEVPRTRWDVDSLYDPDPNATGKMTTRWGGFISDIDQFEPGFFGISPREAADMDPQQRLLLETSWEALEHAGMAPERLMGTDTGVFVGLMYNEYPTLGAGLDAMDGYVITGSAPSVASGRISYVLGLKGPSFTVDTACSSSLVTVHLACQALRQGECSLALAGGVALMLTPATFVEFSRLRGLAPDGRCKSFSAGADGVGWSEGCGMLVLKRLRDAKRDGDTILAVIRGSAINQDGRSNGLTAPNGPSQQAVIRLALAQAGLAPADVDYVECHGTGTSLGDPIEVQALAAALGPGRAPDRPVMIGSGKSNLGHTQAAAGAAGLMKVVLTLQHGRIPKILHFDAPSPHIPWAELPVRVASEPIEWPRTGVPRRAGVSSFGISGTNAHVVLEEAPEAKPTPAAPTRSAELVVLSAKSRAALNAKAAQLSAHVVAHPDFGLADLAFSLATKRSPMEHRLAVTATSREALCAALDAVAQGHSQQGAELGSASSGGAPKVVFVFPGQGSQWLGMGRQLLAEEPAFREALAACDEAISRESGFSILEEIAADEARSRLAEIDVVQPLLFAVEVALAALWRSWGLEPDAVIGHSMGEVAAAHVAGILTMEDAVKVICRRSRLLLRVAGRGAMGLVELTLKEAEEALSEYQDRLGVAVSNGPRSTVLSGDPVALEEVLAALEKRGVFCRRVKVNVASHSPQMDPLRDDLLAALGDVRPHSGQIAMWSTATGALANGTELDAGYWVKNLRAPVLFSGVTQHLIQAGHSLFVELSPHPILLPAVEENLREKQQEGAAIASVRRSTDERRSMLEALATLYARGLDPDWTRLFPNGGRAVSLPTYPWQRERYWVEAVAGGGGGRRVEPASRGEHPLLGAAFSPADRPDAHYWEQWLGAASPAYLADHRVRGQVVFPAAGYVEMAIAAASAVYGEGRFTLEALSFEWMFALAEGQKRQVQVSLVDESGHIASLGVSSRDEETGQWTRHARATAREAGEEMVQLSEPPRVTLGRCPTEVPGATHYARMELRQIHYGPAFQGVEEIWIGNDEAVARVRLPDAAGDSSAYRVHPALLDACFQVCGALIGEGEATFVPVAIAHLHVHRRSWREAWVRATLSAAEPAADGRMTVDLSVIDAEGRLLLDILGLQVQPLARTAAADPFVGCAYTVVWEPKDLAARVGSTAPNSTAPNSARPRGAATWLVFSDGGGTGAAVAEELRERGDLCIEVAAGPLFERRGPGNYAMNPSKPEDYQRIFREVVSADAAFRGVVHCWNLDSAPLESTTPETLLTDVRRGSMSILHVVQELVWQGFRDAPRLLLVTRGAQSVGDFASELAVAQAPLWGLGRTIAMEQPDLACTRVDLDPTPEPDEAASLVQELFASDGEDQIAQRAGQRLVARLERGDLEPVEAPTFDGEGTYLITGGLGGLGLGAARWLVASGARHLLLLGRGDPSAAAREAILAMTAAGAEVRTWRADVARASDVEGALQYLDENMPRVRGIIHAAGVLEDRTLQEMTEEQFTRAIRPKILGGWNLHAATRGIPLDFFVNYSSAIALLGSPGQGNYAAANTFLDALVHVRAAMGLPGMSIQWGAFSGVGLAAAQENRGQRLAHQGIESFTPEEGMEILARLIQHPWGEIGVVRMSIRQWVESYPRAASTPFLSRLRKAEERTGTTKAASRFVDELRGMSPIERRPALERHVVECLCRVLRLSPDRIDVLAPFQGYGMDSLMSLEIRNRLEASLGLRLSAALLFTYPTTAPLVDHLLTELQLPATGMDESLDGSRSQDKALAANISEAAAVAMLDAKLSDLEDYLK